MQPRQLTIIGVGLLGGSIGLAVRSALPDCKIVGCGHRPETLERALQIGAIDVGQTEPAKSVAGSDLVILCTPVGLFENILAQIAPALASGALITDVGSTKRSIVRFAEARLPAHAHFIASHPIAGSEKRGVEFSQADLFRNNLCILTPTRRSNLEALQKVDQFWKLLGMRTQQISPEVHDRLLCDVSHLPHLLAAALVTIQQDAGLDLAGKGFLDTTRIAGGDGALWRDILTDNADNLHGAIARLHAELELVEKMLEAGNGEDLRRWLDQAAERRQKLLDRKLKEINPE
jgi:prephenate dehydrogenase